MAAAAALALSSSCAGIAGNLSASVNDGRIGCENVRSVVVRGCKKWNSLLSSSVSLSGCPIVVASGVQAVRVSYSAGRVRASASRSQEAVREFVLKEFNAGRALKVIAGLQNFDAENVAAVVIAADKGGATHVDIACDPELVKLAISLTDLPVCVSSVEPDAFVAAIEAGAHMVEIGNYDSFYESGRVFSAAEVLELTRKTRELLPFVTLSVTIPHTLPLVDQVSLAEKLEAEGADIIQTEGGTSASPASPGVQGLIEKASPTLAAAYSISKAVRIPVMCASGISAVTAPMACAAGAAGVGVGSAVNKLNDQLAMVAAVRSIADALSLGSGSHASSVSAVAY
ncbi:hypothetical protein BDL97_11G010800 [Sphagnum fallax]|jgi:hypothetical protein|nr:hypothetical protein BDL97_11G010800 [Sphagnum fallax]KAH8946889.1 hypothetical protein BDL97_11G010800 [Sphagnum fallax]